MASSECDHLGLFTGDADRLVRFYCDLLGFEVVSEDVLPAALTGAIFSVAADCRFVKLSRAAPAGGGRSGGSSCLEIFQPLGRRRRLRRRRDGAVGCNHWGLRTGDRMALIAALRRAGATVVEVKRGERPVYFLRDPDGNRIEIRD